MRFTVCVLHVVDMEEALGFYRDVLGLPVRYESSEYVEFDLSPATLALHRTDDPQGTTRGVGIFLVVEDVDAVVSRLDGMGLKPAYPPTDQDYGYRTAMYLDPLGNRVELATPLR